MPIWLNVKDKKNILIIYIFQFPCLLNLKIFAILHYKEYEKKIVLLF